MNINSEANLNTQLFAHYCVFFWAESLSLSAIGIQRQMENSLLSPNAGTQKNKVIDSAVNGNSNIIV